MTSSKSNADADEQLLQDLRRHTSDRLHQWTADFLSLYRAADISRPVALSDLAFIQMVTLANLGTFVGLSREEFLEALGFVYDQVDPAVRAAGDSLLTGKKRKSGAPKSPQD